MTNYPIELSTTPRQHYRFLTDELQEEVLLEHNWLCLASLLGHDWYSVTIQPRKIIIEPLNEHPHEHQRN